MTRVILISAASLMALGACSAAETQSDPAPAPGSQQTDINVETVAPGLTGQHFEVENEYSGYYLPQDEVAIGSIALDHIFVAAQWEAEEYMSGQDQGFPPIGLSFDDLSSPTGVGELGNTYYEVTYWIQPDTFSVTDDGLSFVGQHELLGEIRFAGTWNASHVEQMQAGNPHLAAEALTGDFRIGDVIFDDVTFQGWLGD